MSSLEKLVETYNKINTLSKKNTGDDNELIQIKHKFDIIKDNVKREGLNIGKDISKLDIDYEKKLEELKNEYMRIKRENNIEKLINLQDNSIKVNAKYQIERNKLSKKRENFNNIVKDISPDLLIYNKITVSSLEPSGNYFEKTNFNDDFIDKLSSFIREYGAVISLILIFILIRQSF